MAKKVNCDLCSADMDLQSTTNLKKKQYKVKRYKCPICGFEKSEFGTGYYDKVIDELDMKKSVNKMYKQQERNNE